MIQSPVDGRTSPVPMAHRRPTAPAGLVLLVADPDTSDRERLVKVLYRSGVETVWCRDGAAALVAYGRVDPHAVLVAPHLEKVDAATVVCAVRADAAIPVMVRIGPEDVEIAAPTLVAGAIAVSRPCRPQELIRQLDDLLPDLAARGRLVYGALELDPRAYSVRVHGDEVGDLPLKEFELLRVLMAHADQVVSSEYLVRAVWGDGPQAPSANTIAVHVGRLRVRLAGTATIKRVRGRGYRLTVTK